ncbi:hypothetical protein HII31_06929 [Pseudocercospora fuligena]|uniref:Fungal STAND N-terminal Goodbye domain-containing protein n=1 Tax=Pseudocercospora fuligena TaxID=685502 RepID=A0A8H6RJ02_9PEZI|nr:hypothetical protein HII31_06929 [Pseudocercospora fuligena]
MDTPPFGEDVDTRTFTTDNDLDTAWSQMIKTCNHRFDWNLNEDRSTSVEQILLQLCPPKTSTSETSKKAQKVFKSTRKCVQRLGEAAAQLSSITFGPAQQCLNAVSYVIAACQEFEAVFDNITILMERLSVFLERLKTYLDLGISKGTPVLAPQLRPTVYRVLEHFLTIMGITHKLARGWKGKFKLAMKIGAFGDDEGIQDAMTRLETLVWDVTKTEITTILQGVSESARNIRGTHVRLDELSDILGQHTGALQDVAGIVEKTATTMGRLETADQQRAAGEEDEKRIKQIREALFSTDLVKKSWDSRQSQLRSKHIEGTGEWLLMHSAFCRWADASKIGPNALSIKADQGFGKSHLCSSVIHHLLNKYHEESRIGIAYYYFQNEVSDNWERHNALGSALRAVIYQMALQQTTLGREYARHVSKECDQKGDFGGSEDLWRRMLGKIAMSLEGTYFIVLDGIDEIKDEEALASIVSQINEPLEGAKLRLRLLFTGRPRAINLLDQSTDSTVAEIQLRPPDQRPALNEADVLLYAKWRLNNMEIFKSQSKEATALKERAQLELGLGVSGDYFLLESKLDSISKRRGFREVEEIINSAKESREQAIANAFDQLESALSHDEIEEVNKMLVWATVTLFPLTVAQYHAILSLDAAFDPPISLEMQIRERYTPLFDIDEGKRVTLKSDGIITHLRNKFLASASPIDFEAESQEDNDHCDGLPNNQNGIERFAGVEVSMVQQIIRTHCRNVFGDDQVYNKFGFDNFFTAKHTLSDTPLLSTARIRLVPEDQCHAIITHAYLTAICNHLDDEDYADLIEFACNNLGDHISQIEDLDDIHISTAIKQDIGRKLVRVLRTERYIDTWWSDERLWLRSYSPGFLCPPSTVYNWLCDPTVRKAFADSPEDREWLRTTTGSGSRDFSVLRSVAERLAQRWSYHNTKPESLVELVSWLLTYMSELRGIAHDYGPTVVDLEELHKWTGSVFSLQDHIHNKASCLASTLAAFSLWSESIQYYEIAVRAHPERWRLTLDLALALGESERYEEAADVFTNLIEHNRKIIITDSDFRSAYWEIILPRMGPLHTHLKNYAAAEQACRELFDKSLASGSFEDSAQEAVYLLIEALDVQENYVELVRLFTDLDSLKLNDHSTGLVILLRAHSWEDTLHRRFFLAARKTDQLGTLLTIYQRAADAPSTDEMHYRDSMFIRYYHALFLWSESTHERHEAALNLWEKNMTVELPHIVHGMGLAHWPRQTTAAKLAVALLDSAKASGLTKPYNMATEGYKQRLERLIQHNSERSRRDYKYPRLTYARLNHLMGDQEFAKGVVRDMIRRALEDFQEEDNEFSYKAGVYHIAITLQALDDDVNAIAAWSLFTPLKTPMDASQSCKTSRSLEEHSDSSEEEQAKSGAYDDEEAEHFRDFSGLICEPASTTPAVEEEKLEGLLDTMCDGLCGSEWTYIDDIYSCKDCLDVQLCPACYAKLMNGQMDGTICDKNHSHLHLPKFDRQEWECTPRSMMWVGDKLVSKRAWADEIKREWEIDRFADLVEKVRVARRAAKKLRVKA